MPRNPGKRNIFTKLPETKRLLNKRLYYGLVALGISAAITVACIIAIIIVTTVNTSKLNSTQRFCIVATGMGPVGADSGSPGLALGTLTFLVDDDTIEYDFHYANLVGTATLTAIHLKGPVPEGLLYAPTALTAPLCGSPSTVACNILTPNKVSGSINTLQPSETSLEPVIRSILANNGYHYVQFNTADHPEGELIGRLTNECGKPV